jgi:hypothetical protein
MHEKIEYGTYQVRLPNGFPIPDVPIHWMESTSQVPHSIISMRSPLNRDLEQEIVPARAIVQFTHSSRQQERES